MHAISPGEPIAQGSVADIYAWGEGQILKLFHDWVPAYGVEHEARMARVVYASGLPVPAVGEVVEINDRFGLIYELIDGETMADELLGTHEMSPETILQMANVFAKLHANIHTRSNVPELPILRQQLGRVIRVVDVLP